MAQRSNGFSCSQLLTGKKAEIWISVFVFFGALVVFLASPVRSLGETQYTMLLAHSLIHSQTFALDRETLRLPERLEMIDNTAKVKGLPLEVVDGRIYKYAPPGSSILSVPFILIAEGFGLTPLDAGGRYDANRELMLSAMLAALLMAGFAVICFHTSLRFVPRSWSLAITLGATFGTQVWSTASRVVEPDSWTLLLMMGALFLLQTLKQSEGLVRTALLASLLAGCYLVHPTTAVPIVAITVYVFWRRRRSFVLYTAIGTVWFLLLVIYSWHNFHQVLPNYFRPGRLGFQTFWEALAGNVISPSRGLLIYVPVLLFVAFTVARYRRFIAHRRLVAIASIVVVVHLVVISGFSHWWAGHSYGPRYWTSVVPWFVLLSIAGVEGMLEARRRGEAMRGLRIQLSIGSALVAAGIFIHARGATSEATRLWNARPYDIDLRAGRLWDWRYPQFLAGLIHPPLPAGEYPAVPLNERLDMSGEGTNRFLWYGWSDAEPRIRWTEARETAIVFSLSERSDTTLIIRAMPFIVKDSCEVQRIWVNLNGEPLETLTLEDGTQQDLALRLPGRLLRSENVLELNLPDAQSPARLGLSDDRRLLGIAAEWIEFRQPPSGDH